MKSLPFKIIILFFLLILSLTFPIESKAQNFSLGIASSIFIEDQDVEDGDIVSYFQPNYHLSKTPYDSNIVGIVSENAAISLSIVEEGKGKNFPLISQGVALVNVSSSNGAIKKGDNITSSETPGVGMKADKGGVIIGKALEDFSEDGEGNKVGKISVALSIGYSSSSTSSPLNSFSDIFNLSSIAATSQPSLVVKYVFSGIILLSSFALGFLVFSRVATKGVEALGRNPLAAKTIQVGIIFNVLVALSIIFSGIFISYLVVRL